MIKWGLPLVLGSGLCLLPASCERESSHQDNVESPPAITSPADLTELVQPPEDKTVMPPPVLPDKKVATPNENELTVTPKINEPPAQTVQLQTDQLQIEQFSFTFHKESQQEICGDWDYFVYNGEMTISGRLVSQYPIDMTDPDFEMSIDTPLESYTLPAVYQRDDHDGGYVEKVIHRKGRGQLFQVKDFRVDDDDRVYRNDDDVTGTYENHGPLLSATFDLDEETFKITIEQEDYSAYDVEPGEEFEILISMPRADTDLEDFDQEALWIYQGTGINADDYTYDGDCL